MAAFTHTARKGAEGRHITPQFLRSQTPKTLMEAVNACSAEGRGGCLINVSGSSVYCFSRLKFKYSTSGDHRMGKVYYEDF